MARIRSIKPEAFQSETLAEVSLAAERTFYGLSTLVDDRGRIADKPAVINGALWAVRSEYQLHTAADLDSELAELEKAGAICRYIGCDGKRYLHFVTWDEHQKVDKASRSRVPRCPHHRTGIPERDYCGRHDKEECPPPPPAPASPRPPIPTPAESSPTPRDESADHHDPSQSPREDSGDPREDSRDSREPSALDLGPRTVDRGPVPPSAGTAPPRRASRSTRRDPDHEPNAGDVVAAWVEAATQHAGERPANRLIAQVGRQARELLGEGKPIDRLIEAATAAGGKGFADLGRELLRLGAKSGSAQRPAANGSGPQIDHETPLPEKLEDM